MPLRVASTKTEMFRLRRSAPAFNMTDPSLAKLAKPKAWIAKTPPRVGAELAQPSGCSAYLRPLECGGLTPLLPVAAAPAGRGAML